MYRDIRSLKNTPPPFTVLRQIIYTNERVDGIFLPEEGIEPNEHH